MNLMLSVSILGCAATVAADTPSTLRKGLAGFGAPVATATALSATGFAVDTALKYGAGINNPARPWIIGALTAYAAYHLFLPTTHVFYTLFSNDYKGLIDLVGQSDSDKGILHKNEEAVKEILREILYVKNELIRLEGDCHRDEHGRYFVVDILQKDLFTYDLPKIIDDKTPRDPLSRKTARAVVDVLKATAALVPVKDKSNSHWWNTRVGKVLVAMKDVVVTPYKAIANVSSRLTWNFKEDSRLLATLGGASVEKAADTLVKIVKTLEEHKGIFATKDELIKLLNAFYMNAEIIIKFADVVLQDLKTQRETMQRVRDVVFLLKKPTASDDEVETDNEYSMNVLSNVYA